MSYILNGKIMIIRLIAGLIKKHIKLVNTFLNHLKKETLTLKLIYLIIQKRLI